MKMKTSLQNALGIPAIILCLLLLGGCSKKADDPYSFTFDKDTSYAWGMYLASQSYPGVTYDYKSFMEGFKAYSEASEIEQQFILSGREENIKIQTRLSMDEAINLIQAAFERLALIDEAMGEAQSEQAREEGIAFLTDNARRPGVVTTSSGLQYEVIREGSGIRPEATDSVRVHYEGKFIDGTLFDSSYARGEPLEFFLENVIPGWTEGLQLMSEGSEYNLFIPYTLGYGADSYQYYGIPNYSTLIFRVELLSVIKE